MEVLNIIAWDTEMEGNKESIEEFYDKSLERWGWGLGKRGSNSINFVRYDPS